MTKPRRTIKYRSAKTGVIHDTKEAAIRDNWLYINNPSFRVGVKQDRVKPNKDVEIPFIKDKKITLTNAGLATGAVLSTNMLDSIAKYADRAGLPLKTAIGLAVKESTLGNPTDDTSIYKILSKENEEYFRSQGTGQHINNGRAIEARELINYYGDNDNPYTVLINTARNSKDYEGTLLKGEHYADKLAEGMKGRENINVLEAGFRSYAEHPERYNLGQRNYQQLVNKRAEEVWSSPEIQEWNRRRLENAGRSDSYKYGGIHIAPSKKGTFTAVATKHGMGVQEFAARILRNKEDYSPSLVKKANFARNASKWH